MYGLGSTWTDQQWLAQVVVFGALPRRARARLDPHGRVRRRGLLDRGRRLALTRRRARAIWVVFLPVLVAAPWAWSIRAQMLALALYTSMLWLLATQGPAADEPRVRLALPLLVVWANVHGGVALGVLLVMLLGAYELVRSRGGPGSGASG